MSAYTNAAFFHNFFSLSIFSSNHSNCVYLQWLVGSVVGRDDTLYARMKQRDLEGHDSMWEPIFVDDAAIGLGDQKNKVWKKRIYKNMQTAK